MSYTIDLRGGPHDGEIVEVLNPPPIGQPVLELGDTAAPYRVQVYDRDAQDGPGPGFGVGYYVARPGVRPWTWDSSRGEWVAGDVIPSGAPLGWGEAGLAVIVGSAMGVLFGILALSVYVVGWLFDWLAQNVGGWLNLIGYTAIGAALGALVWAVLDPDMVRQPIPASNEDEAPA